MSEREYRRALAAVLAEIEAETRRLGRKVLIPAALGAGLALGAGGCGDDTTTGPTADTYIPRDAALYADTAVGWPDAIYGIGECTRPDVKRDTVSDAGLDTVHDATTDTASDATGRD